MQRKIQKRTRLAKSLKNVGNWAEENKFWSDTLRAVILGILGTILIATIVEQIKNSVAYKSEKDKAKLFLKISVIKEFAETSYRFTSLAVRYREGSISFTELRNVYDNYRSVQHQMKILMQKQTITDQMQRVANKMVEILNKKDSLINTNNSFEVVRFEIKALSDSVELISLEKL